MATSTLGSGTLVLAGTTSGTTTVTATAVAGTTTLTLPAATDTLVGRATTDTLTNKTLTSPTITGGALNGTVGATTPATGAFTTLSASGNVTLGDASTDTLNVGNGDLVKDASGNLGLGVTPSAWNTSQWTALEGAYGGALAFYKASNVPVTVLTSNAYNDGGWKYQRADPALQYEMDGNGGTYKWYQAASGANANDPITFTQAMTLDASGNLLVGKTSASAFTTVGTEINATGFVAITRSGSLSLLLNRETNNGEIAQFRRSNTTVGSIDVTTTGVTLTGTNGITFTATQSASSDANTLDDYEEGTYTVTLTPQTSGTITLSGTVNEGAYTKVGRVVTITAQVEIGSVSSPNGSYIDFSIPFAIANLTDNAGRAYFAGVYQQGGAPFTTSINRVLGIETFSTVRFYITAATVAAGDELGIAFSYFTD